jgi:2-keto-4-pentenoate hydratase/2-oxohepta-3-ene-1,7-dioic acid hydratase in catechol pathway
MKLASFTHGGVRKIGSVADDEVRTIASRSPNESLTLRDLLDAGDEGLAYIRRCLSGATETIKLRDVKLEAPIAHPRKFLGLGGNYHAHIAEIKRKMPNFVQPDNQVWFNKQVTCVIGPTDEIHKPRVSDSLDYEAELAVVIGRRCRHVQAADAHKVIAGYMVCNDVSLREWQMRAPTQMLGKSFDTHGPTGPWLTLGMSIDEAQDLEVKTHVNGGLRQHGRTSDFIYGIREMIAELTTVFTLEPGDILATGTPPGVGAAMTPPGFLRVGDVVRIEIEKLGMLENPVVAEPAELPLSY